jgi:ABC-type branched-subunit amino acid transport system ATPase component
MTKHLELHGLSKRFGRIVACDRIELAFQPGSVTAIIGPNGADKTTMLNMIAGAFPPDAGSIRRGGIELVGLPPHRIARLGVARVFQDLKVFTSMTVLENLIAGRMAVAGARPSARQAAADPLLLDVLARIGLAAQSGRRCRDLSYAERKLVALGRTICASGGPVLLDEPASGLDGQSLDVVLALVDWLKEEQRTRLLVEHNLSIIDRIATRAILLEEGRVIADGVPRELFSNTEFGRIYFSFAA